jgi:hypothetical protein
VDQGWEQIWRRVKAAESGVLLLKRLEDEKSDVTGVPALVM